MRPFLLAIIALFCYLKAAQSGKEGEVGLIPDTTSSLLTGSSSSTESDTSELIVSDSTNVISKLANISLSVKILTMFTAFVVFFLFNLNPQFNCSQYHSSLDTFLPFTKILTGISFISSAVELMAVHSLSSGRSHNRTGLTGWSLLTSFLAFIIVNALPLSVEYICSSISKTPTDGHEYILGILILAVLQMALPYSIGTLAHRVEE